MSTYQSSPPVASLVLYKIHPARVVSVGEKIEIELDGGQSKRVRPKDVELLHPGPVRTLAELVPQEGELSEAWELLEGTETTLKDLTELAFTDFTPATAWATWQRVSEGLTFTGTPGAILARSREAVERDQAERDAKRRAEADWQGFIARMAAASPAPEDAARLGEVEQLALGRADRSRVLEALGYPQTPESAQRALVEVRYWPAHFNPHPLRCGAPATTLELSIPDLPSEERRDLTHLDAFAIDDEGNQDPDDAISLDGDRLWVHVADVAALVDVESEIEREARSRGTNLYLPEGVINMLPTVVTERMGLGLQEVSPALSFGFHCTPEGELRDFEIVVSWVRVQRLSYAWVEERLDQWPFAAFCAATAAFRARRQAQGATGLDLPEVSVKVVQGQVHIRQLPRFASRALVTDAMLMVGAALAHWCREQGVAIPYATQTPPEPGPEPADLAAMFARRRAFKPSRLAIEPDRHAGLGLDLYCRATSPLRRYSDLLVHQQVRAALRGAEPLTADAVAARIAESEAGAQLTRRAERLSNLHWKLVYLRDHRDWRGEGVVVGLEERKAVVLIPALALETRVRVREPVALNQPLRLAVNAVDVPELTASFRILG